MNPYNVQLMLLLPCLSSNLCSKILRLIFDALPQVIPDKSTDLQPQWDFVSCSRRLLADNSYHLLTSYSTRLSSNGRAQQLGFCVSLFFWCLRQACSM